MTTIDFTGIKKEGADAIVSELGGLLADFQIFYTNVRGLHWNIKGRSFFTLHKQFEDQYNYISERADEIAERILMLSGVPENNYSHYLKVSSIKEISGVSCEDEAVNCILDSYKVIIAKERAILDLADAYKDEATVSLLSNYIQDQEKTVWMLVASRSASCKETK
jgi:starvation-inducible DNA-binding protein